MLNAKGIRTFAYINRGQRQDTGITGGKARVKGRSHEIVVINFKSVKLMPLLSFICNVTQSCHATWQVKSSRARCLITLIIPLLFAENLILYHYCCIYVLFAV